jgi:midasin
LHAFSTSKLLTFDLCVYDGISRFRTIECKLADALNEVLNALIVFDDLQHSPGTISHLIADVRIIATTASASRDRLTELMLDLEVNTSLILLASMSSIPIIDASLIFHPIGEFAMISDIGQQFELVSASLVQWSKTHSELEHVFRPVQTWLDSQDISLVSPINPQPALSGGTDSIIDVLLVNVQAMLLKCPVVESDNTADDDNFIRDGTRFFGNLTSVLRIDVVLSQLLTILPQLANLPQDDLQKYLLRFLPFLDRYAMLVQEQLSAHSQWTQALFKLDFILCSVLHTIAKQGFCKPPEGDESGLGGDTTDAAGIGLGEGSGTENVSKEIEDESQVEGIQGNEDGANDPRDDTTDDNTIEMSEDFSGALEDVPENGSENDSQSDEESEAEPEEQLGDLDASDPTAVDEKLWGDEPGPQGNDEAGKTNEDRSEEQGDSSDVVAKEDQQPQPKEPKGKKGDEDGSPETEEDIMSQEDAETENGDEPSEANGAPLDDHAPDANTLDLPDDMDLRLGDDMPEPDLGGESEEDLPDTGGSDNQNALDDAATEAESPLSQEAMEDEPPGQMQEAGEGGDVLEEEHTQENVVPRPDVSTGDSGSAPDEPHNADTIDITSTGQRSSGLGDAQGQSTDDMDQTQEPAG